MGVSGRGRREWHLKGWLGSEKNHAIAFYSIPLECRVEQANKQDAKAATGHAQVPFLSPSHFFLLVSAQATQGFQLLLVLE